MQIRRMLHRTSDAKYTSQTRPSPQCLMCDYLVCWRCSLGCVLEPAFFAVLQAVAAFPQPEDNMRTNWLLDLSSLLHW